MLSPRITIRLSPILAAKVGPRGNVADVVRQALEAYLEGEPHDRQPSADTTDTPTAAAADMAARLAVISGRLAAVEARVTSLES